MRASVAVAPSLQSTGSVGVAHGRSCSVACGSSQSGIEPVSPALASVFFTPEPPRKPQLLFLDLSVLNMINFKTHEDVAYRCHSYVPSHVLLKGFLFLILLTFTFVTFIFSHFYFWSHQQ